MNINEAYKYIQGIARQNQIGHIPTDKLNIMFAQAQMEVLDDLWGNKKEYQPGRPVPTTGGFERNQTISDELAPLVKSTEYNQSDITIFTNESYIEFAKPSDYMYLIDLRHRIFKNPTDPKNPIDGVNKWVRVDIKTQDQVSYTMDSQIVSPDADHPTGVSFNNYIHIYPTSVNKIKLIYLKKPIAPVWAYTTSGTVQTYDPVNSVNFELSETVHNEICQQVLSYFAISTRDQELYQTVSAEISKGV